MSQAFTGALISGPMADWCKGNRTASAVTVRWRVTFSAVAACTGTTGSFSPLSLEQLESNERTNNAALNIPRCHKAGGARLVLPFSTGARQLRGLRMVFVNDGQSL